AAIAAASETTAPNTSTPADSGWASGSSQPPRPASVPVQLAADSCEASSTTAAGVRAGQPRASRSAATEARLASPINTTIVAVPGESDDKRGAYASSACPETTTKAVDSPRWVTGMPASAGAATAEVTPGTTSYGIP